MSFQNCQIVSKDTDSKHYHALKGTAKRGTPEFVMSPSSINAFARLPSRWVRGWNPPDSKPKKWGDLIDCRTLTPELFAGRYAIQPEIYGPEDKKWNNNAKECRAWTVTQIVSDKTVVTRKVLDECDEAVKRLFEPVDGDDTIQRWFDSCDRQVLITGEWKDEETGLVIPVSALLDFVPRQDTEFPDSLGDLKSSKCGHAFKFARQGFEFGYHRQAAFDMDIFNAATGEGRTTWAFIIVENFRPWEPNRAIYGQSGDMGQPGFIELGREAIAGGYQGILADYCQCLKRDKWPGYNQNDETVQGWCILRPEPFQAERARWSARMDFGGEAESDEAPEAEEGYEDVTP